MYPPKSLWEATFPISILRFARYLWHSMQKLRGARLVLYAKRKGVMQILRLLWKGGCLLFISAILPKPLRLKRRGFVVSLSAYLTFKVNLLCIYLGALFKSIFFVRQISIMIGRKETIMRCEWFTSSVIFCIMEKNLLLLCGVCVASEWCVRYELLDLTYKYSH